MSKEKRISLPMPLKELAPLPYWVGYKFKQNGSSEKKKKIPMDPNTGGYADVNKPTTWGTYDKAVRAVDKYNFDGVGFVFVANSGYMGIDIDHAFDQSGKLTEPVATIVARINSYTEYSPSGTGIHIIIRTDTKASIGKRDQSQGLEIYNNGRFFTVTGKPYGAEKLIADRSAEVRWLMDTYFSEKKTSKDPLVFKPANASACLDDDAVWEKALASKRGSEIQALRDGDMTAYDDDHSRADQALINHLIYWTNGDTQQADRMFRSSGLMRKKWDEKHGNTTYGEMTIQNAVKNYQPRPICTQEGKSYSASAASDMVTEGQSRPTSPVGSGNKDKDVPINETKTQIQEQEEGSDNIMEEKEELEQRERKKDKGGVEHMKPKDLENVRVYLTNPEGLKKDLQNEQQYRGRTIGFKSIDEKLGGLNPGMYVIAAGSGQGKTTFALQTSVHLAKNGEYIIYFSLEQNNLELTTKCLSCATCEDILGNGFDEAVSAIGMRRGRVTDALKKVQVDFINGPAQRMRFVCCEFDTTVKTISDYVKNWINQSGGKKPVVVIDYLQIMRPEDPTKGTKEGVDDNLRTLKILQKDYNLTMFLLCSTNRASYLESIDYESIKESGGIEFTADFVCGLQPTIMDDENYIKASRDDRKKLLTKAKIESPRKMEFVCLKNRFGEASFSCELGYYAAFDCFVDGSEYQPALDTSNPFWDKGPDKFQQADLKLVPFEDADEPSDQAVDE